MAERRMFSKAVAETDQFLEMPLSAQALYFHLGLHGDDDGFVGNPKRIVRMTGAAEDDIKLLIAKGFLIAFESGVVVIRHWKINNYLQGDRCKDTLYSREKSMLMPFRKMQPYALLSDMDTTCIQPVYETDTTCTPSIDENSIDKHSIDKGVQGETPAPKRKRFAPPTVDEIREYAVEYGFPDEVDDFVDHYTANGWMCGRVPMKDWKAAFRKWCSNTRKQSYSTPTAPKVIARRADNVSYDELYS